MSAAETERRVEEARASLIARIEEIGRRVRSVRERIDVERYIVAHPLVAVGAAFAAGVALAALGGRKRSGERATGLRAVIGSLAVAGVKEIAMHQLRGWLDPASAQAATSRQPEVESFLAH